MKPAQFERMWTSGTLSLCFYEKAGKFQHKRLDEERLKQANYKRRQSDNGKLGGRPAKAMGISGLTQNEPTERSAFASASAIAIKNKKEESAAPLRDSSPTVLTFPAIGKGPKSWALTEAQVSDWVDAYPGIDVRWECGRALAWVNANGPKTAKGMPAFLVRWLNRAADSRGSRPVLAATGTEGRGRTGAPVKGKYDGIEEHD
jgi:hypothetical protein